MEVFKLFLGDPGAGVVGRVLLARTALRLGKGDGIFVGEHGRRPTRESGADAALVLLGCRKGTKKKKEEEKVGALFLK